MNRCSVAGSRRIEVNVGNVKRIKWVWSGRAFMCRIGESKKSKVKGEGKVRKVGWVKGIMMKQDLSSGLA